MDTDVMLFRVCDYDQIEIYKSLPDKIFSLIKEGDRVVLKPNWVMESHKIRKNEWEYVITHPTVVTAVLRKTLDRLQGSGSIVVTDGPMTEANFSRLISYYPVESWQRMAEHAGVSLEIVDLREHEWITHKDIVVKRKDLPGDPKGKSEFNLEGEASEFWKHEKSKRGYYGADYDIRETNRAHDGCTNRYSVSRTVMESDVFINLPKLKTHRKAGVTCCLKNLVGINTYKNYLPHHSEGGPSDGGDQFPGENIKARVEGPLVAFLKQNILRNPRWAKYFGPVNDMGKRLFGKTGRVVRSGNWHGNDTIWRMIADLNKILFFGNPDGTMRDGDPGKRKRYIGVVDAIRAGEGFGPLEPDPVDMRYLLCGTNPAAIDTAAATLMGLEYRAIPSISKAYDVRHFNFTPFRPEDIRLCCDGSEYGLASIPKDLIVPFEPPLGWKNHVEKR